MAKTDIKLYFLAAINATILIACNGTVEEQSYATDSLYANTITLSFAQFQASNIKLAKIEKRKIANQTTVNGKLDVPPQNMVIVSAPMGGFVKSTGLLQGMKVSKGESLAVLENMDYIQMQQDYLDNVSKLEFLQAEYSRQQELSKENVNALKSLQQAQSQFESIRATVKGLEAKLAMINISPESVRNGVIRSTIVLPSPINGFVTTVNVSVGQFVTPTEVMFKIVNLDHIHAELQVYERDINRITVGQRVTFRLATDSTVHTASVHLVGKEISPERTVRIHCHLDKEDPSLLPGMFVTANIETASVDGTVVPSTAISTFEGRNFIFVSIGERQFQAVPVEVGIAIGEYTEIRLIEKVDLGAGIVTRGAFELMGLLENKQE